MDIYEEVKAERSRQDEKWGGIDHDKQHTPDEWVQLAQDYLSWARVMAGMDSPDKYRRRMVQVASLAIAAIEAHDHHHGQQESSETCEYCNGTGRDPMSDTCNWLPCPNCTG